MKPEPTKKEEPFDRLTNLANDMIRQLDETEGTDDVRAVVMLTDGTMGGVGMTGYDPDDPASMLADVMQQVSAIFSAHGVQLMPVPMKKGMLN